MFSLFIYTFQNILNNVLCATSSFVLPCFLFETFCFSQFIYTIFNCIVKISFPEDLRTVHSFVDLKNFIAKIRFNNKTFCFAMQQARQTYTMRRKKAKKAVKERKQKS